MDEPKSKSQKKREADHLQAIGVKLIALSKEKLDTLPLSPNLHQAIIDAKRIKSHGALRRQCQLIGKLMRADDYQAIIAAYQALINEDGAQTAAFHAVEQWRDRLIHEGTSALTEFINHYRPDNVQQLRQLVKKAVDEHVQQGNHGASKALFRFLRSCRL